MKNNYKPIQKTCTVPPQKCQTSCDFKIFPCRFQFHCAAVEKPPPAGTAMVVVMLFGQQMMPWFLNLVSEATNNIAITFTASLSTGAGSCRKINEDKWKWSGFGQWWLQYLSVSLPAEGIDKKNHHQAQERIQISKKSWFKNNIFTLAKVVQDHFLSG